MAMLAYTLVLIKLCIIMYVGLKVNSAGSNIIIIAIHAKLINCCRSVASCVIIFLHVR